MNLRLEFGLKEKAFNLKELQNRECISFKTIKVGVII